MPAATTPTNSSVASTQTRSVFRVVLALLAAAAFLWLVFTLRRVVLLLALTVFCAYLLAPLVDLVQRAKRSSGAPVLDRALAVGAAYLLVFGGLGAVVAGLLPALGRQFAQLVNQAPGSLAALSTRAQNLVTGPKVQSLPPPVRDALGHALSQAGPAAAAVLGVLAMQLAGILKFLPWVVLVPIIAFFLLKDAPDLRTWLLSVLPQGRSRWRGRDLFDELNRVLASFVRAQLISCTVVAILFALGLSALGVPYALILGVVAGVLEFIPMLGSALSVVFACCVAASVGKLGPTLGLLLVLRVVQDYVIYPRLIGSGLRMRPIAIILALICGSQLGGVAGLFLAIPLVAIATVLYRHLRLRQQADGLISALFGHPEEHAHVAAIAAHDSLIGSLPHKVGAAQVRILIVDNDEDARETIAAALREESFNVSTAASASEAIETLRRELPQVLISDIGMPGEDGLDLIRRVRNLPAGEGRDVRAAALTGYSTHEDQERILSAGFQMHLKKPVEAEQLRQAIATLLAVA